MSSRLLCVLRKLFAVSDSIVTKFLHTRMRVDDLDRTISFYQQVFGLEVTKRHESPRGSKLVFLAVPNSDEEIEITYFPNLLLIIL